jgi:hypothetical protein
MAKENFWIDLIDCNYCLFLVGLIYKKMGNG